MCVCVYIYVCVGVGGVYFRADENDPGLTCSILVWKMSKLDGEARLCYFFDSCELATVSAST